MARRPLGGSLPGTGGPTWSREPAAHFSHSEQQRFIFTIIPCTFKWLRILCNLPSLIQTGWVTILSLHLPWFSLSGKALTLGFTCNTGVFPCYSESMAWEKQLKWGTVFSAHNSRVWSITVGKTVPELEAVTGQPQSRRREECLLLPSSLSPLNSPRSPVQGIVLPTQRPISQVTQDAVKLTVTVTPTNVS